MWKLNSRVDILLSSGWTYVELNEYGRRIKDKNVSDGYIFLSTKELIDLSLKKKKTIGVLRVVHRVAAPDTVDINFGTVHITTTRKVHFYKGLRFKKAEFTIGCGGTDGYQPDIRFVLDKQKNSWEILHSRYVSKSQ